MGSGRSRQQGRCLCFWVENEMIYLEKMVLGCLLLNLSLIAELTTTLLFFFFFFEFLCMVWRRNGNKKNREGIRD
ncbi:hypothetical protein LINPERHAP1_LOCUS26813 [Linum perenne]